MKNLSKANQAYLELRQQITSGAIPANSQLVEEQLCSALNISRTPLRTAMRQLADEGYITLNHNKSATVKSCTLEDLLQVFEVSAYVDAALSNHLSNLFADGTLCPAAMDDILLCQENMEAALNQKDLSLWAENDAQFHSKLIDLCENPYLARTSRPLRAQLDRGLWFYTLRAVDLRASTAEHRELLNHILAGDGKAAEKIALRHCKRTRKELASLLLK